MSLSLKAELETWAAALKAYDAQDFDTALDLFSRIADSSKILTNMGLIYATIGEHETAVEQFTAATNLDSYLAVAYFQCGVSNFLLGRYDLALRDFDEALLYLRGNQAINYEQIGLKFKLFSAEVLFNKGLSRIYLGYMDDGLFDMQEARKEKVTDEHNVIDDAIRDHGEGYTVFSIPVGVIYRPSENKLKNSKSKDYLGKAKLVAASDSNDITTEFSGVARLKQGATPQGTFIDTDVAPALNRSATTPAPRSSPIDPLPKPPNALGRSQTTIAVAPAPRERPIPDSQRSSGESRGNFRPEPRAPPSSDPRNANAEFRDRVAPLRPKTPTQMASRRTQSVSNPADAPSPPISRSNTTMGRTGLSRSNTSVRPGQLMPGNLMPGGGPGAGAGGVTRGVSVRRPQQAAAFVLPAAPTPAPAPVIVEQPTRDTNFYDDYINSYSDELSRSLILKSNSPPPQQQDRVVAWAQSTSSSSNSSPNLSAANSLLRAPSRGATSSPYTAASYGAPAQGAYGSPAYGAPAPGPYSGVAPGSLNSAGGTLRRKPTRRTTVRRPKTAYEEPEEGYVSGEYEEAVFELSNIRVKLHYQGDVRGMTLTPETPFEEFVDRVTTKFGTAMEGLGLKFKDEDGVKITLRDESDYELAIETARESAKGKPEGKLEIWCTDM
ncbi:hypothetical protein BJ138DRAFT_1142564 [Hygrophoropsis aurantiaca]|uniref:Uncharacterized protein n=1 Tax=Hygrophoropsis aurantiaca TaxID=72124 RepID=A0ACB8AQ02_9AGAM|nr:hypothetical protein BJ138DRAFT_1142564 [Hygrophoropsis aurantiaca]